MENIQLIPRNSQFEKKYMELLQQAFSRKEESLFANDKNICFTIHDEIVGGASVSPLQYMSQDPQIGKFWQIENDRKGLRVSKLWTQPKLRKIVLPGIIQGICSMATPETYFYGVLSVSLQFSRTQNLSQLPNLNDVKPHISEDQCDWCDSIAPSSDGRMLYKTYLKMGGQLLGSPAGSPQDYSMKVILGQQLKNANFGWLVR